MLSASLNKTFVLFVVDVDCVSNCVNTVTQILKQGIMHGLYGENTSGCLTRKKEMVYLTTHSTHFIYGYRIWRLHNYGKGQFIQRERKPAAATNWATVFD